MCLIVFKTIPTNTHWNENSVLSQFLSPRLKSIDTWIMVDHKLTQCLNYTIIKKTMNVWYSKTRLNTIISFKYAAFTHQMMLLKLIPNLTKVHMKLKQTEMKGLEISVYVGRDAG